MLLNINKKNLDRSDIIIVVHIYSTESYDKENRPQLKSLVAIHLGHYIAWKAKDITIPNESTGLQNVLVGNHNKSSIMNATLTN